MSSYWDKVWLMNVSSRDMTPSQVIAKLKVLGIDPDVCEFRMEVDYGGCPECGVSSIALYGPRAKVKPPTKSKPKKKRKKTT